MTPKAPFSWNVPQSVMRLGNLGTNTEDSYYPKPLTLLRGMHRLPSTVPSRNKDPSRNIVNHVRHA